MTATVGTTLAPWGLAFIGSLCGRQAPRRGELRYQRIDVVTGAIMTGVIGAFVVIACAATVHAGGRSIDDARDAATALEPLAGSLAATLFGVGLLGAALLAASVVPLSTAYSVSEAAGHPGRLDDPCRKAPVFYGTYAARHDRRSRPRPGPRGAADRHPLPDPGAQRDRPRAAAVGDPALARDRPLVGEHALGGAGDVAARVAFAALTVCVTALGWLTLS